MIIIRAFGRKNPQTQICYWWKEMVIPVLYIDRYYVHRLLGLRTIDGYLVTPGEGEREGLKCLSYPLSLTYIFKRFDLLTIVAIQLLVLYFSRGTKYIWVYENTQFISTSSVVCYIQRGLKPPQAPPQKKNLPMLRWCRL